MASARSHIIAVMHRDLAFVLGLADSLANREIGVVPSSLPQNLDVLLRELHLEPEILVVDSRIAGVCPYAAASLDRWPRLSAIFIISDHHTCNYCERFPRVPADEGYLVETVSSLIQEIAVTKSGRAKASRKATKKRRIKKHFEGGSC